MGPAIVPALRPGPFSCGKWAVVWQKPLRAFLRDGLWRGAMAHFRTVPALLVALSLITSAGPGMATPGPVVLNAHQAHDLRCAAAIAVVAAAQANGDAAARALVPLGQRGRRYFAQVGARLADETGMTQPALRDLFADAARSVARDGAIGAAQGCLPDLDAAVPPHPAPDALACLALLEVYAEVLGARGGADPLAPALRSEAAALAPAARALLMARRIDPGAQADAIEHERSRVRSALTGGAGTIDGDDFAACRHLAQRTGPTARPTG